MTFRGNLLIVQKTDSKSPEKDEERSEWGELVLR
jgi:hypothetical protein